MPSAYYRRVGVKRCDMEACNAPKRVECPTCDRGLCGAHSRGTGGVCAHCRRVARQLEAALRGRPKL